MHIKESIKKLFIIYNKDKKQIINNNKKIIEKIFFIINNLNNNNILLQEHINNEILFPEITVFYKKYCYKNISLNNEVIKKLIALKTKISDKKNITKKHDDIYYSIIKYYNKEKNNLNKEYTENLFYKIRIYLKANYCSNNLIEKYDDLKDDLVSYSTETNITIVNITNKIYNIYLNLLDENRTEIETFEEKIKPIILKCASRINNYILKANRPYIMELVLNECKLLRTNKLFVKNPELFINNLINENIENLQSLTDMLEDYNNDYKNKKTRTISNEINKKNKVRKRNFLRN